MDLGEAVVTGGCNPEDARRAMQVLHQRNDACRVEFMNLLNAALSAPIDREDLYRLARALDEVLSNLRDFLREARLFSVDDLTPCGPLFAPLGQGVAELGRGVDLLVDGPKEIPAATQAAMRARQAAEDVRKAYEYAISDLLATPDPATPVFGNELMKQRELLRRLDVVGLRTAGAANALADGCVKRGR